MNALSLDLQESHVGVTGTRSRPAAARQSKAVIWTGRVLGGAAVLFLAMDAAMKLFQLDVAIEGTTQLGYDAGIILPLGVLQVILIGLYLVPRTALLGAILWTGYLGGAVATHVLAANPLFSHVLFPTYVAALLWASLCIRDGRVAAALGFRR